jgi:hypothetical protein
MNFTVSNPHHLCQMRAFLEFPWLQGSVMGGKWTDTEEGAVTVMMKVSRTIFPVQDISAILPTGATATPAFP